MRAVCDVVATATGLQQTHSRPAGEPSAERPIPRGAGVAPPIGPASIRMRFRPKCDSRQSKHARHLEQPCAPPLRVSAAQPLPRLQPGLTRSRGPLRTMQSTITYANYTSQFRPSKLTTTVQFNSLSCWLLLAFGMLRTYENSRNNATVSSVGGDV